MVYLLLASGANVYVLDRQTSNMPVGARSLTADVADFEEMRQAFQAVINETGRIDAIFNNAGVIAQTSALDTDPDQFAFVISVNAGGVLNGIRAALPFMIDAGHGAIVNTASGVVKIGMLNRASYSASKGAVVSLTRQVAFQYAPYGIRCNSISPGGTDTPMIATILDH